jgi:hypothetical protein
MICLEYLPLTKCDIEYTVYFESIHNIIYIVREVKPNSPCAVPFHVMISLSSWIVSLCIIIFIQKAF